MKKYNLLTLLLCITALISLFSPEVKAISEDSLYPFVFESKETHEVKLLNDGSSSFYKRLDLIRHAKKTIVMEYFIFNHDVVGKIMAHELIKKVKEGVKVQILVDNFMVGSTLSPHHSAELLRRGIEIKYYSPIPVINAVKTQYRNHRKLFVVDDQHYIVGGRNIGDDYFDLSERYNFVDRDAVLTGPSALSARKSFDAYFKSKHSKIKLRTPMPTINQLEFLRSGQSQKARILQQVRADRRTWKERKSKGRAFLKFSLREKKEINKLMEIGKKSFEKEFSGTCENLQFVSDKPLIGPSNDKNRITRHYIYKYLTNAKSEINIDSPYFILNDKLIDIIEGQLDKDIPVTLLTNGIYSSDALPVAAVFNHYLKGWIEKGLSPSVYSGKNLYSEDAYVSKAVANSRWGTHSKTLSIDDELSVIGSFNFDPRSADFSMELVVACHGNASLAKAIKSDINLRRANSISFETIEDAKRHEFHNISMFKQMGYYLIKPLSLLLQGLL